MKLGKLEIKCTAQPFRGYGGIGSLERETGKPLEILTEKNRMPREERESWVKSGDNPKSEGRTLYIFKIHIMF